MDPFDFAASMGWQFSRAPAPDIDFVQREIRRVGASEGELRRAMSLLASEASLEPRAYAALSRRMQRLVDLLALAGPTRDRLLPGAAAPSNLEVSGYAATIVAPMPRRGLAER